MKDENPLQQRKLSATARDFALSSYCYSIGKQTSSNGLEKRPKLRFPGFDEPYVLHRIGDIYAERSERGAADMELLSVTMNGGVMQRSEIEGKDNSSEDKSNYKVVRKGDISIGINSGTGSPTVSKHIRKQIEKAVPDYYADIAVFMGKLREYVKANFKEESQRRYILKTAAAEAFAEERVLTQKEIEEIIRQGPK